MIVDRFGGLDLRADKSENQGATETKNVMFDTEGRVRTRPGYASYGTATDIPNRIFTWPRISGSQYIAAAPGRLQAFASGTAVASVATAVGAAFAHDFAAFGSPTVEYVYTVGRSDASRRWDGASFTAPAGIPDDAACCTVSPNDNRLVLGGSIERSKVHFSDAGAPETFTASSYVYLTPGDGEEVVALATYSNMVFAFKQTKFFVFHGNSVGTDGNPIFNYRTVDTGIGCSDFWPGSACTGPDGVYFRGVDGIYKTSGGPPVMVSQDIEPVFRAPFQASGFLFGGASDAIPVERSGNSHAELRFVSNRLLVVSLRKAAAGTVYTFAYDRPTNSWTYWDTHAAGTMTAIAEPLPEDTTTSMLLCNGTTSIFKMQPTLTTDNGTAIASHYLSGFNDMGSDEEKRLRRVRLWGSGTPTVSVFTDYGTTDANAAAVTLGTAPAVDDGWHSSSYRGRNFAFKLSATSGAWSVNRVNLMVADSRGAR